MDPAVVFGASGLDRAAHLRGQQIDITASVTVMWRGKPLVNTQSQTLVRLPQDHAVLGLKSALMLFLGLDDGAPLYAADISDWEAPVDEEAATGSIFDASQQRHPALPEDHAFCDLRSCMASLNPRDAELAATARGLFEWHRTHGFCANCGAQSTASQGGWQRDCPVCARSHFPRTDPVVIMLITDGDRVLLGRSPGWPDKMYSLLAGFVEPGETIEAAARREVFEEAGVRVGRVRYLASQPWPFPASLMFGVAGEVLDDKITVDKTEIEDARWVTKAELIAAQISENPEILPARRGAIAHHLISQWLSGREA